MSEDVLGYSSHDWRKHTDNAVVGTGSNMFPVNDCKVGWISIFVIYSKWSKIYLDKEALRAPLRLRNRRANGI